MYYIIELTHESVNLGSRIKPSPECEPFDIDVVQIRSTIPGEHCGKGPVWVMAGDWPCVQQMSVLGQFSTLDDARAAIPRLVGDVREHDIHGNLFGDIYIGMFNIYKKGRYHPLIPLTIRKDYEVRFWADIKPEATDDDLAGIAAVYESMANANGITLGQSLMKFMKHHRDVVLTPLIPPCELMVGLGITKAEKAEWAAAARDTGMDLPAWIRMVVSAQLDAAEDQISLPANISFADLKLRAGETLGCYEVDSTVMNRALAGLPLCNPSLPTKYLKYENKLLARWYLAHLANGGVIEQAGESLLEFLRGQR